MALKKLVFFVSCFFVGMEITRVTFYKIQLLEDFGARDRPTNGDGKKGHQDDNL